MSSLYDGSFNSPLVVNFNSKDRIAGTNSNFVSAPIDLGINKFDSVCLVQASISKSYYNMPTNFNEFILREADQNGVYFPVTITIPVGSYNKLNLANKLSALMTASSNFSITYTVTNPNVNTEPDTFKFTFTASGVNLPSVGGISLIFDDTSPFRQLGFEASSTNDFIFSGGNFVLLSSNAINLSFILRAFIKTNLVQNANDSILEEILSLGSYPTSSLCYYQQYDFNMNTREFNQTSINSWNFVLVDSFDQEIDLNGIPWAFSIVFYTRNRVHELHKTELQIINEERLFKIEKEQQNLKETFKSDDRVEEKLTTFNGLQMSDTKKPLEPIFPVYPFSAGLSYLNEPEIKYPQK